MIGVWPTSGMTKAFLQDQSNVSVSFLHGLLFNVAVLTYHCIECGCPILAILNIFTLGVQVIFAHMMPHLSSAPNLSTKIKHG